MEESKPHRKRILIGAGIVAFLVVLSALTLWYDPSAKLGEVVTAPVRNPKELSDPIFIDEIDPTSVLVGQVPDEAPEGRSREESSNAKRRPNINLPPDSQIAKATRNFDAENRRTEIILGEARRARRIAIDEVMALVQESEVDKAIDALREANIVFDPPSTMLKNKTEKITLILSENDSVEELFKKLEGPEKESASVKYSSKMRAELIGENKAAFEIVNITPPTVAVTSRTPTTWMRCHSIRTRNSVFAPYTHRVYNFKWKRNGIFNKDV